MSTLTFDFHFDLACPWSYLAKNELDIAVRETSFPDVEVKFTPYLLQADIAPEGMEFSQYVKERLGADSIEQAFENFNKYAAQTTTKINFSAIKKYPNTILAHALVLKTPEESRSAMISALMDGYFAGEVDLGNPIDLIAVAKSQGLPIKGLKEKITGEKALNAVVELATNAVGAGIEAVPHMVVNDEYYIPGAQMHRSLLNYMDNVAREMSK